MEQAEWEYMVALRRDIMAAMNGIANADSYLWWDNTTPNSTTRGRLKKVLQTAIRQAAPFGIYVVTRHADCGRRSHDKTADAHGYVWTDVYGLNVEWQDRRFVWGGDQLFQGVRDEPCPCSQKIEPMKHHVIDDFIYRPETDVSFYRSICGVLLDIQLAIEEAGDKKPRSGIRERLLRAILILNDAIMPVTVEEHIAASASRLRE
jgi:hypothetical protein